jgi:integrase
VVAHAVPHLTQKVVDAATYDRKGNAAHVLWDNELKGFGLRVYPSGRKAFLLSYRNAHGTKRAPAIGDATVMRLGEARSKARRLLVAVDDHDADPSAERRQHRLEAKTGTVAALMQAYVEARTKDAIRPMKRPESALWYAKKFINPRFGSRPWRDIRRTEVREWHAGIKKPYNANRALQAMRAAYYWRLWQEDDSPGNRRRESDTRNPCAGIKLRSETRRQVRLELAELPKLEKAINASSDDPYLRAYFRFVLATGCRRGEALALKWRDVEDKAVTFRNTKAGTDHTVPLSAYAAQLLKALPRLVNNPHVFVSRQHGKALTEPSKAWQKIRKLAGLKHLRIHDLRRTFGSWLGDAGFTSKQIGTTLGHKSDITSRVYMALGDQSKRAAVDAVERLMTGKPAKVQKLSSARQRRA